VSEPETEIAVSEVPAEVVNTDAVIEAEVPAEVVTPEAVSETSEAAAE
jgi:hypothetical protein